MDELPKVPASLERIPDELFFPMSEGSPDFTGDRMRDVEELDRLEDRFGLREDWS